MKPFMEQMKPFRKRMRPFVWFASLLSAITLSTATHGNEQGAPNPLKGSSLYRAYCLVCHGEDGKTLGAVAANLHLKPADLSTERYQVMNVEDLAELIGGYQKKASSKMPNWGLALSREDLLDIAAYVSRLTKKNLRFRGDTRRGRITYKSACSACHGKFGTGRGLLAQLIRIQMIDFTRSDHMKKISDEELVKIIRNGKGDNMPSWKGVFSDQEIIDVASYVRMLAR